MKGTLCPLRQSASLKSFIRGAKTHLVKLCERGRTELSYAIRGRAAGERLVCLTAPTGFGTSNETNVGVVPEADVRSNFSAPSLVLQGARATFSRSARPGAPETARA